MRVLGIILICCVIILSACNTIESFYSSDKAFDEKLLFDVYERSKDSGSNLTPGKYLELQTEKIYSCIYYRIISERRYEGDKIIIVLYDIKRPITCFAAFGPAKTSINLNIQNGKYKLVFRGMGFNDEYDLIISDSSIIIEGDGTDHTKPAHFII